MNLRKVVSGCVVTAALLSGAAASAQTLADVARAEESRRKTVQSSSKVYTNDDLRRDGGGGGEASQPAAAPQPAAAGDAASSQAGADAKAKDAAQEESKPDEPARDQAYWSGRIKQARSQLDRSQMFLAALESRINALNADFVNRDDPAQRAVVERDRQRAVAEMARVRKDIAQQTKEIADIEDEARRAGVPPGWLR